MTTQRFFHMVGILCILLVLLVPAINCSKDYSYEGDPVIDTTTNVDTTNTSSIYIPSCSYCSNANEVKPNSWTFTINGTVVCGKVTRAVRNAAGTALTFFGPSACSQDTGVIITAYFIAPGLSSNTTHYPSERVGLEYYDKVKPSNIAVAPVSSQFSLVIERYNQQSGEAIGIFQGQALTAVGESITITAGKFNIRIE